MSKVVLLLAVLALVWWLWRSARRSDPAPPAPESSGSRAVPQDMVCCALCQLHVPRHEAVLAQDRYYCCPEHRLRMES